MVNVKSILKQLPKLYLKEVQLKIDPQCSICYAEYEYNTKVRLLCCGHYYHTECISEWVKKQPTCPYCTAKFEVNCDMLRQTVKRRQKVIRDTVAEWREELSKKQLSELNHLDLRFLLFDKYDIQFTGPLRKDEIAFILQSRMTDQPDGKKEEKQEKDKQEKNENNDFKTQEREEIIPATS